MKAIKYALLMAAVLGTSVFSAESEPIKKTGLTIQLVTDQNGIVPGEKITVGLMLRHEPTYHTYWKSPGIVGVPTTLKWKLPEGFSVGKIQWPAPMRTKMATLTAWGYETDTCMLTEITIPQEFEGKTVSLKAQAGWMCCASACHPDWQDVELVLPVLSKKSDLKQDKKWAAVFDESRERFPVKSPKDWVLSAKKVNSKRDSPIVATFALPTTLELAADFSLSELYFFCEDNQVNSDAEQVVEIDPDRPHMVKIRFTGTDFGPEDAKSLDGVLFHPKGWPGLDSDSIEVSTSWQPKNEQKK